MTGVRIMPTFMSDIALLVADLRKADRDELVAAHGDDFVDAIFIGVKKSSESWSIFVDGSLMAIYGVTPLDAPSMLNDRRGWGWLLTTTVVEKHKRLFWQLTYEKLGELLSRWRSLENYIDARHTRALRWGVKLGFQFGDEVPYGESQLPARRFVITKETFNVQPSSSTSSDDSCHSRDAGGESGVRC